MALLIINGPEQGENELVDSFKYFHRTSPFIVVFSLAQNLNRWLTAEVRVSGLWYSDDDENVILFTGIHVRRNVTIYGRGLTPDRKQDVESKIKGLYNTRERTGIITSTDEDPVEVLKARQATTVST